jgi:hypothetical protein
MNPKSSLPNPRLAESLAMEHHRLHIIEEWPEGTRKEAALNSVQCSLAGLFRSESSDGASWRCIACGIGMVRNGNRASFAVAA